MKRFKLRAWGYKKFFWVVIYDSIKQLRTEASEYDKKTGYISDHNDVLGECVPYERKVITAKGKVTYRDNIGIIRLAKTHTFSHIVVHEVLHAAFWQYRLSLKSEKANFGKSCGPKEEKFNHIFTNLYIKMIRQMYKHKYW